MKTNHLFIKLEFAVFSEILDWSVVTEDNEIHLFVYNRIDTEVPALQDVEGPKRIAPPPPTGQTTGPKWTIFGRDTP